MKNRTLLAILPYFAPGNKILPYPGFAFLKGGLKKQGYEAEILDLRNTKGASGVISPDYLPSVTSRTLYLHDIYELPLLISLAENFAKGNSPEPDSQVISSWALERDFLPERVQKVIGRTQDFVMEKLNLFENSRTVVFALDYSNLYISAFTALKLKKQQPGIKIIFTGPQIERSENLASFLIVSGIADAVATRPEHLIELISGNKFTETIFPDYGDLTAYKLIPVEPGNATPEAVMRELLFLKSFYRKESFFLCESLPKKPDWFDEFSSLLIERNEKIRWSAFLPEVTPSQALKFRKAGLVQTYLNLTTQADFSVSVNSLIENGIFTCLNLATASPGETETTFYSAVYKVGGLLKSLAKAEKLNFFRFNATPFQPVGDIKGVRIRTWQEHEKSFIFPGKYVEIASHTPCTYEIDNILAIGVLNRLFLLRNAAKFYN